MLEQSQLFEGRRLQLTLHKQVPKRPPSLPIARHLGQPDELLRGGLGLPRRDSRPVLLSREELPNQPTKVLKLDLQVPPIHAGDALKRPAHLLGLVREQTDFLLVAVHDLPVAVLRERVHDVGEVRVDVVEDVVELVGVLLGLAALDVGDLEVLAALGLEHAQVLVLDLREVLHEAVVELLDELLLLEVVGLQTLHVLDAAFVLAQQPLGRVAERRDLGVAVAAGRHELAALGRGERARGLEVAALEPRHLEALAGQQRRTLLAVVQGVVVQADLELGRLLWVVSTGRLLGWGAEASAGQVRAAAGAPQQDSAFGVWPVRTRFREAADG